MFVSCKHKAIIEKKWVGCCFLVWSHLEWLLVKINVYKLYNNLSVGLLVKVVNQVKTYWLVLLLNKTKNFIRKNGYCINHRKISGCYITTPTRQCT